MLECLAVEQPFPHLLAANLLTSEGEAAALSILRQFEWKIDDGGFFRIRTAARSDQLASLPKLPAIASMIRDMKNELETYLQTSLGDDVTIAAQEYDTKSIIGFHTDYADECARLVVNLNSGWQVSEGGVWVLSSAPSLDDARLLPPLSNTAFAFLTGSATFHALTRRSSGLSYALVVNYPVAERETTAV